jgi:hypothetical protein
MLICGTLCSIEGRVPARMLGQRLRRGLQQLFEITLRDDSRR